MLEDVEDDPPYEGENVLKFPIKNMKGRLVDNRAHRPCENTGSLQQRVMCVWLFCAVGTRQRWTSQMKWPKAASGNQFPWPLTAAKLWNAAKGKKKTCLCVCFTSMFKKGLKSYSLCWDQVFSYKLGYCLSSFLVVFCFAFVWSYSHDDDVSSSQEKLPCVQINVENEDGRKVVDAETSLWSTAAVHHEVALLGVTRNAGLLLLVGPCSPPSLNWGERSLEDQSGFTSPCRTSHPAFSRTKVNVLFSHRFMVKHGDSTTGSKYGHRLRKQLPQGSLVGWFLLGWFDAALWLATEAFGLTWKTPKV